MCDSSLKRKCSSVITYLIDTDTHTCFSPASLLQGTKMEERRMEERRMEERRKEERIYLLDRSLD